MEELELKEDYSGLSREEALELASDWYEKGKIFMEKEFDYENAIEYAKKSSILFKKWEDWEHYVDTRGVLLNLWLATHNSTILKDSLNYSKTTLQLCRQKLSTSHPVLVKTLIAISQVYAEKGRFLQGLQYALEALELSNKFHSSNPSLIGQSHQVVSMGYQYLRNYPKGIEHGENSVKYFSKAFQNGDIKHSDVSSVYLFLGAAYYKYGDYENALEKNQKALELALKARKISAHYIAPIYANLGAFYGESGDVEQQVLYNRKSYELLKKEVGEAYYITVSREGVLGIALMENQQFEESLYHLQKSLKNLQACLPKNHFEIGKGHFRLAHYYTRVENHKESLLHAQKSVDIYLHTYGDCHLRVISSQNLVISALSDLGKHQEAEQKMKSLILRAEKTFGKASSNVITLYCSFAELYLKAGSTTESCQKISYAESLQNIRGNRKRQTNNVFFNSYHQLFPIIRSKASIYFTHYSQKTHSFEDLQTALNSYLQAVQLLDKMKTVYHSDSSKLVWGNTQYSLYMEGIIAALEMNSFTSNSQKIAFQFSEKAKAFVLLASLQTELAKTSAQIPTKLQKKEKQIKLKLTYLEKSIQQLQSKKKEELTEYESKTLSDCQNEFFYLHQNYTNFLQQLEADYPDYYQLKYDTKTVSPSELQSALQENQVVISYFVGKDKLYIFVTTPDEFEVIDLQLPTDFEALVQGFMDALTQHQQAAFIQKSYQLHQLLIAPIRDFLVDDFGFDDEEELKQVFVIPHGVLSYLPFEALISSQPLPKLEIVGKVSAITENSLTPEGFGDVWSGLDYLIHHCQISYHYSATLLYRHLLKKQTEEELPNSFGGFAPIYDTSIPSNSSTKIEAENEQTDLLQQSAKSMQAWATRSEAIRSDGTWVSLPHSETEAKGIAQLFEEKGLKSETFLREKASKEGFAEAAKRFKFLLVAAHGLVNDEKTALSGLVFYPTADSGRQTVDGGGISNNEYRTPNNESPRSNPQSPTTNHQLPITKPTTSSPWKKPIISTFKPIWWF